MNKAVEIYFEPDRDATGYSPNAGEWLWARPLGIDRFRVLSVPLYIAAPISEHDVIEAKRDSRGSLAFSRQVCWGGHLTVRVFFNNPAAYSAEHVSVRDDLQLFGAHLEGMPSILLLAVSIPPTALMASVKSYLGDGVRQGRWQIEEAVVTEAWIRA